MTFKSSFERFSTNETGGVSSSEKQENIENLEQGIKIKQAEIEKMQANPQEIDSMTLIGAKKHLEYLIKRLEELKQK